MFEVRFASGQRRTLVLLPFDVDGLLDDWSHLRSQMIRRKPEPFTRDEWAYLIGFLDRDGLDLVFRQAFGEREMGFAGPLHSVARPAGPVAVWLPNNVGLLGPLALVLISLTGNAIWMKAGSHGDDLTQLFLEYVLAHLPQSPLRTHLESNVVVETFSRQDPRNQDWAARARTRIVFGTDSAVDAVHALPHPADSVGFSFGHRQSEAWLDLPACDDRTLESLLRVFAVYGQAACTSPGRVVLLDEPRARALELRDRFADSWKDLFPRSPEMGIASTAILDHQWATALGWDSLLADRHAAVFAVGKEGMEKPEGLRILTLVALTLEQALQTIPARIQTIGHAVSRDREHHLLHELPSRGVKRFVPLADMHRFGPVWDGQSYWQQTFERMEVG